MSNSSSPSPSFTDNTASLSSLQFSPSAVTSDPSGTMASATGFDSTSLDQSSATSFIPISTSAIIASSVPSASPSVIDTTTFVSSIPAESSTVETSSVAPSTIISTPSATSTTVVTGPTIPATTRVITSVQTFAPASSDAPAATSVVVVTRTSPVSVTPVPVTSRISSTAPASSSSGAAGLQAQGTSNGSGGGLGKSGTVAVAVVVPIVVVALLVALGIFFWRKRKSNKNAREQRRQEVEEYGYNPNDDPTLPAVVGVASDSPEMSEENGYRGWGNNTNGTMSARKPSTNMSSNGIGMAVSDGEGRGHSPGSPGTHSHDPLMDGAGGAASIGTGAAVGAGGAYAANRAINGAGGINRGPSNASSSYSAAGHTDDDEVTGGAQDLTYDSNYSQYTPYNPAAGSYGDNGQQPVIRDVSARRNTKIENAVYPQPGNSGIAQNF